MQLYASFDLHSNNSFLGIKDENGRPIFRKKLPNDPERFLPVLQPYRNDIVGIVDDAFWLCDMLRLNILPEGHIYPREDRPVRDLLRKRMHLRDLRTSLIVSLQNIICRNNGFRLKTGDVKVIREDRVTRYLGENEDLALAGTVSKEAIDYLTRQLHKIETDTWPVRLPATKHVLV